MEPSEVLEAFRCVACRPETPCRGKFLHCLHVMCGVCLNRAVDSNGWIVCKGCFDISRPQMAGENLRTSLVDFIPDLYCAEAANGQGSGPGAESFIPCDFCDDTNVVSPGNRLCLDCTPRPTLCETHAAAHVKRRLYQGHRVVSLIEQQETDSSGSDRDSLCPVHTSKRNKFYCTLCEQLACESCLVYGHRDINHKVVLCSKAAAHFRREFGCISDPVEPSVPSTVEQVKLPQHSTAIEGQAVHGSVSLPSLHAETGIEDIEAALELIKICEETAVDQSVQVSEDISRLVALLTSMVTAMEKDLFDALHKTLAYKRKALDSTKLKLLEKRRETAVSLHLARLLNNPHVTDSDVIRLGCIVRNCLKRSLTSVREAQSHFGVYSMQLVVKDATVAQLGDLMNTLARVKDDGFPTDIIKHSHVVLPSNVVVGNPAVVWIRLRNSHSRPITLSQVPCLSVQVKSPTGDVSNPVVTAGSKDDLSECYITLWPVEVGAHALTVGDGTSSATLHVTVTTELALAFPEDGKEPPQAGTSAKGVSTLQHGLRSQEKDTSSGLWMAGTSNNDRWTYIAKYGSKDTAVEQGQLSYAHQQEQYDFPNRDNEPLPPMQQDLLGAGAGIGAGYDPGRGIFDHSTIPPARLRAQKPRPVNIFDGVDESDIFKVPASGCSTGKEEEGSSAESSISSAHYDFSAKGGSRPRAKTLPPGAPLFEDGDEDLDWLT